MLSTFERFELTEMDPPATSEEVAWAERYAHDVDPGTDTPAVKLQQRRAEAAKVERQRAEDAVAESPLSKFERVWGAAA